MDKIWTDDQLIGKLVVLLREFDPDKLNEFIEKAKKQLDMEAKQAHLKDLADLFDAQIATLKDCDVPEQIVEELQKQKRAVIEQASCMAIGEGNIPFLPVIKLVHLGYYGLMSLVWNGDKEGRSYLNPTAITDEVKTPDDLYYVYDVEDGKATCGKSPKSAKNILEEKSRSPLTVAEVIALTVHTDVLSRHYVLATGSSGGSADVVPCVYLVSGDRPCLDLFLINNLNSYCGTASCGSR